MKIRTCTTLVEAQFLCSLLDAEGISASIPEEQTPAPYAGVAGGYSVNVPDGDAARAAEVLASAEVADAPAEESPQSDAGPRTRREGIARFFKPLVGLDALLLAILLSRSFLFASDYPPAVEKYLMSLAAAEDIWSLGYLVYLAAACVTLCGSILMLFGVRFGFLSFSAGQAAMIGTFWVYPGEIVHGIWSVIGSAELVFAGMIIATAALSPEFRRIPSAASWHAENRR